MLKGFRCYQESVALYHKIVVLKLPRHLSDQVHRAASSVSLNSDCYPHLLMFKVEQLIEQLAMFRRCLKGVVTLSTKPCDLDSHLSF